MIVKPILPVIAGLITMLLPIFADVVAVLLPILPDLIPVARGKLAGPVLTERPVLTGKPVVKGLATLIGGKLADARSAITQARQRAGTVANAVTKAGADAGAYTDGGES
jgi:hypothetical protein